MKSEGRDNMATAALLAVSLAVSVAMGAAQMAAANKAANQQQKAAEEAAVRKQEELARQQARADLVAQEEKSDAAREADIAIGTMLAGQADTGATVLGIARLAGGIGGIEGLDIARIESNRQEGQFARNAEGTALNANVKSRAAATKAANTGRFLSFVGNSASAVASTAVGIDGLKSAPTPQSGGVTSGEARNFGNVIQGDP
jgi:hypothetical protein